MIALAVTIALLCGCPPQDVACDSVDLVELNHYYDKDGRLVFDQAIFWDWCFDVDRFHVRAWRMVKCPSQIPRLRGGRYVCEWYDGDVLRRVSAPRFRETWTQFDPEVLEREFLPEKHRRELTRLTTK